MSDDLFDKEFKSIEEMKGMSKKKPIRETPKMDANLIAYAESAMSVAAEHGVNELGEIYMAFSKFVDSIRGLALFPHVEPFLKDLGFAFDSIGDIISGEYSEEPIVGLTKEQSDELLRKTRGVILGDLWNHYK